MVSCDILDILSSIVVNTDGLSQYSNATLWILLGVQLIVVGGFALFHLSNCEWHTFQAAKGLYETTRLHVGAVTMNVLCRNVTRAWVHLLMTVSSTGSVLYHDHFAPVGQPLYVQQP